MKIKKMLDYLFIPFAIVLVFNLFFKSYAAADPQKAYDELTTGKAIFLDVREKDEVEQGMIKGALWFPLSDLSSNKADTIKKIKETSAGKFIYVYCRSGRRADKYISEISAEGLTATNLGGFEDLVKAKLPTQPKP
ncbi:MAG: rhodanese-like domain-containing protein [Bacteriovoracaceae bacterium]